MSTTAASPIVIDSVTIFSLLLTVVILIAAYTLSSILLPTTSRPAPTLSDRITFIWLTFDALIHFLLEGSFLYHSFSVKSTSPFMTVTQGANASKSPMALLWQEYAKADARWGTAEPTVVALELLTVFCGGPMCVYIASQIVRKDPARHFWIVVLSTAELYGGFMTFAPEWLTGNPSLDGSNPLFLWVYLFFFNMLWVVIPFWLLWDSYHYMASRLRSADIARPKVQ